MGQEPQPGRPRVRGVDDRGPGDDVMQGPAPVAQQDAGEPRSREQDAQRERRRAHDRPAPACIGAVVPHRRHAGQRHAGGPAAGGPAAGEVDEPPGCIRDDHPDAALVPGDVPAGQRPGRERDGGQGEHEHAGTDPPSAAKAAKRDAKPAYLPCRLSRMTAGAPGGRGVARARSLKGRKTGHSYRYPRAGGDCDTGPTGAAVLHAFGLTAGILEHDDRWTPVAALGGAAPGRGRWPGRRRGPAGTGGCVPLVPAHGT